MCPLDFSALWVLSNAHSTFLYPHPAPGLLELRVPVPSPFFSCTLTAAPTPQPGPEGGSSSVCSPAALPSPVSSEVEPPGALPLASPVSFTSLQASGLTSPLRLGSLRTRVPVWELLAVSSASLSKVHTDSLESRHSSLPAPELWLPLSMLTSRSHIFPAPLPLALALNGPLLPQFLLPAKPCSLHLCLLSPPSVRLPLCLSPSLPLTRRPTCFLGSFSQAVRWRATAVPLTPTQVTGPAESECLSCAASLGAPQFPF